MSYTSSNKWLILLICTGLGEYLNEFKNAFDSYVMSTYRIYACPTKPKTSEMVQSQHKISSKGLFPRETNSAIPKWNTNLGKQYYKASQTETLKSCLCLFNNAVSNSYLCSTNDRIIRDKRIRKEIEGSGRSLIGSSIPAFA
jgi:hypothetical protein